MSRKKLTYESAYAELHQILNDLQEENISLDELAAALKRARELVQFCHEKLHAVESELEEFLDEEE